MSENGKIRADLEGLVGREMVAIYFVQDYVQLVFDGATLTCVSDPEVRIGGRSMRFPNPGSRDGMCELIGRQVEGATLFDGERVQISFAEQYSISVSLRAEDRFRPNADAVGFVDRKVDDGEAHVWWL